MPAMKRMVALGVALAALVVVLVASGNAPVTVSRSGNTDGVFPHRIVVGALSSQTGPLPADFAPVVAGASAYLAQLNASGGVDGRTIDLADSLDDFSSPSEDASQARTLVDEDHVFAVVAVATPLFTGASYLASHDVPTFGLNVNPNSAWSAGPSMFGNTGSYSNFSQPQLQAAFLAEQNHVTSAAVLAYNVAQSQQGCEGVENAFTTYGVHVAYEDTSIPAPAIDLHADVNRMKAAGVDMVVSCMDLGGNVLLAQTMQQAGLGGALQYWFDGYDPSTLSQFGKYMQNTYFLLSEVPFEVTQLYPGQYPGMDRFQAALRRYEPGTPPSGAALAGWMSADLFTTGLRAIGRDVTRTPPGARHQPTDGLHRRRHRAPRRLAHGPQPGERDHPVQRLREGGGGQVRARVRHGPERVHVLPRRRPGRTPHRARGPVARRRATASPHARFPRAGLGSLRC